jgi:hypothetical protein
MPAQNLRTFTPSRRSPQSILYKQFAVKVLSYCDEPRAPTQALP